MKECWSLPTITFFAIEYSPPAYPFICNLKNLHYVEEDKPKVLKLIRDTIRGNAQARACIVRYNTNPDAFDQTINSLYIEPLLVGRAASDGGGTRLTWNIYATPPSQNAKRNNEWRRVVSSLIFVTTFHGAGQANKALGPCSGCRSLDHPCGLCPFPLMDGWIEPPPQNSPAPAATRGRGQKRGNLRIPGRARGRARDSMWEGPSKLNYI
jgi:hypothetical protein